MKSFLHFLKRNPYYTLINILGLSIALMFVILIGDYTWRQFSTDSSQPNKDRIVLMGRPGDFMSWPEESWKIGEMYPEIENTCCVISQGGPIRSDMKRFEATPRMRYPRLTDASSPRASPTLASPMPTHLANLSG